MISEVFGISEEREICLPNKEYLSDHKCERHFMGIVIVYISIWDF